MDHTCSICGCSYCSSSTTFKQVNGDLGYVCASCARTIYRDCLKQVNPFGGTNRFCRVCGSEDDKDLVGDLDSGQGWIPICRSCSDRLEYRVLQKVGLDPNWRLVPRLCGTCSHERDGRCHYAPLSGMGGHPTCSTNGGCDLAWVPRLAKVPLNPGESGEPGECYRIIAELEREVLRLKESLIESDETCRRLVIRSADDAYGAAGARGATQLLGVTYAAGWLRGRAVGVRGVTGVRVPELAEEAAEE